MPGPRPIVAGLGWVGFDPRNDICPTMARMCAWRSALDSLGAAPVRGSRYGGGPRCDGRVDVRSATPAAASPSRNDPEPALRRHGARRALRDGADPGQPEAQ